MTLIEEINCSGVRILFYDGIDFDMIFRHESEDFLIFFIDSWAEEAKRWKRESRIKTIVEGTDYKNFSINELNNPNVAIYQTSGRLDAIYKTIRDKVLAKNTHFWGTLRGFA
jgi:hypothetical protein